MKTRIKRALLSAFLAAALPAEAQGLQPDAMQLAINHFNLAHSRELRSDGAEYRFMAEVLKAVGEAEPLLKPAPAARRGPYFADPYRSLWTQIVTVPGSDEHEAQREQAEALWASVRTLVADCPYRRSTSEEMREGGPVTTSVVTTYELKARGGVQCANLRVTDALVEVGLEFIRVEEEINQTFSTLKVYASHGTNRWRDMDYVRAEALQIDGAQALIGALETHQDERMPIGRSKSVTLMDRPGAADFSDTLTLRYFMGRGDCPAGCIEKRFWIATVIPSVSADGHVTFDVKVVEEGAAPRPARRSPPRRMLGH